MGGALTVHNGQRPPAEVRAHCQVPQVACQHMTKHDPRDKYVKLPPTIHLADTVESIDTGADDQVDEIDYNAGATRWALRAPTRRPSCRVIDTKGCGGDFNVKWLALKVERHALEWPTSTREEMTIHIRVS